MDAVLFVLFLLAFVLVAPAKIVAFTAAGLCAASLIVQATANAFAGVHVTLSGAFKTLVITFLLSTLAAFILMSFALGGAIEFQHSVTSFAANVFTYGAYVLGFRIGLGLTWRYAAIVAAISSLVVGACIWLAVTLMPATPH